MNRYHQCKSCFGANQQKTCFWPLFNFTGWEFTMFRTLRTHRKTDNIYLACALFEFGRN